MRPGMAMPHNAYDIPVTANPVQIRGSVLSRGEDIYHGEYMDLFDLSAGALVRMELDAVVAGDYELAYAINRIATASTMDERADGMEVLFEELVLKRGLGW